METQGLLFFSIRGFAKAKSWFGVYGELVLKTAPIMANTQFIFLEDLIMAIDEKSLRQRQIMIGRAKKMFDEGRSWKEICDELRISESTVRSIRHTIEQAEINRGK